MGCDIHIITEVRKNGKWELALELEFPETGYKRTQPFDWRGYNMFGFFAGVRNYSNSPLISEPKGLPSDSEYLNKKAKSNPIYHEMFSGTNGTYTIKKQLEEDSDYHTHSFLTLKEILDYDYEQKFEDLRTSKTTHHPNGGSFTDGAHVVSPGKGSFVTMKDFLGKSFFEDLEILKKQGNPEDVRIVFWFDN